MKRWLIGLTLSLSLFSISFFDEARVFPVDGKTSLADVIETLEGKPNPNRPDISGGEISAQKGKELFFTGTTQEPGSFFDTRRISKFFTCDACHNSVREDPDISNLNPEDRLEFAIENNIPFLPGTTFFGVVNRESYYNGDYFKKYGQLVYPARESLRESIQLCATECSQGRRLEPWEVESIVAYFWELEIEMEDLELSSEEMELVENALASGVGNELSNSALTMLKSKYPLKSPATFLDPPGTREERIHVTGDPIKGEHLFEASCQYCHYDNNFSYFLLNESKMTMKYLYRHLADYDIQSVYQVARYGTPPKSGKRAYMPQYTEERMSKSQMVDLITFIRREAGKL